MKNLQRKISNQSFVNFLWNGSIKDAKIETFLNKMDGACLWKEDQTNASPSWECSKTFSRGWVRGRSTWRTKKTPSPQANRVCYEPTTGKCGPWCTERVRPKVYFTWSRLLQKIRISCRSVFQIWTVLRQVFKYVKTLCIRRQWSEHRQALFTYYLEYSKIIKSTAYWDYGMK